jgi:hypothetical protein
MTQPTNPNIRRMQAFIHVVHIDAINAIVAKRKTGGEVFNFSMALREAVALWLQAQAK